MNSQAVLSAWESDVLGVRVGTLNFPDNPLLELDNIRAWNREHFDVIFVRCEGWVDPMRSVSALDYLYEMEAQLTTEKPRTSCVSLMCFPSKRHIEIALEAFPESRFYRDHRLSDRASSRYVRWLSEHQAYVPTEAPDDAFLVTQDDPDGARRISLIAVSSLRRSTGIGDRLVTGVLAIEPTRKIWRVRVSARNYRAIRFYERVGFRVKSVSTTFHVWTRGGRENG